MYFNLRIGDVRLTFGQDRATSKELTPVDGEIKLLNAAKYLVASRGLRFDPPPDPSLADFFTGLVISNEEAAFYEALHIFACLVTGRDLHLVNAEKAVDWLLDEADKEEELAVIASVSGGVAVRDTLGTPSKGGKVPDGYY